MSAGRQVEDLRLLRDAYGDHLELSGGGDAPDVYRIIAEFAHEGRNYAVLQSEASSREEEVDIFRIETQADGLFELETIEDDDEWESVSEIYDEMAFPLDDPE